MVGRRQTQSKKTWSQLRRYLAFFFFPACGGACVSMCLLILCCCTSIPHTPQVICEVLGLLAGAGEGAWMVIKWLSNACLDLRGIWQIEQMKDREEELPCFPLTCCLNRSS